MIWNPVQQLAQWQPVIGLIYVCKSSHQEAVEKGVCDSLISGR